MQITAAVARAIGGRFSLEEVSLEEPRPEEVLVRLVATGICHTDISMRDHKIYPIPHPVVLGHEGAGVVERVGSCVTRVSVGDHVVLTSNSCGHCPSCIEAMPVYCYEFNAYNFSGTRRDGSSPISREGERIHYFHAQSSFATHSVAHERCVVRVRKDAPLELLGPLGCGVMTGSGAIVNSMKVGVGKSVAVFGTGSVGLSAIMAAKLVGAGLIIAVDQVPARLELALELGATHALNAATDSVADAIKDITRHGAHYTLDTTGNMRVLRTAMDVLAPRGTCGYVGGAPPGAAVTINVEQIMVGGRTIRGIIEGDSNPNVYLPHLIDLFMLGRFPFDRLVRFYPFESINDAVEDAFSGRTIKPVLRFPSGEQVIR
jgi:aryl-alcohol dehydrogenase